MKELFKACIRIRVDALKLLFVNLLKIVFFKITLNEYFTALEVFRINSRLRFWKTIYLNLRTMPWRLARKTPVWVYGDIRYFDLSGSILPLPSTNVQAGTFRLGHMDPTRSCGEVTAILLSGTIFFGNKVELRQGAKVRVSGELVLHDCVFVADNSNFSVRKSCTICCNTLIANNTSFMDNDVHYLVDIKSKEIKCNYSPIIIGENNWIGPYTMIKKGSVTNRNTIIIGPGTCLCKDYTNLFPEFTLIGGTPPKLIKEGYRLVFNFENEKYLNAYFSQNDKYYVSQLLDKYCTNYERK